MDDIIVNVETNGQKWDENSLLANFVSLLYNFKLYSANGLDWKEVEPVINEAIAYLKTNHNIDISFNTEKDIK